MDPYLRLSFPKRHGRRPRGSRTVDPVAAPDGGKGLRKGWEMIIVFSPLQIYVQSLKSSSILCITSNPSLSFIFDLLPSPPQIQLPNPIGFLSNRERGGPIVIELSAGILSSQPASQQEAHALQAGRQEGTYVHSQSIPAATLSPRSPNRQPAEIRLLHARPGDQTLRTFYKYKYIHTSDHSHSHDHAHSPRRYHAPTHPPTYLPFLLFFLPLLQQRTAARSTHLAGLRTDGTHLSRRSGNQHRLLSAEVCLGLLPRHVVKVWNGAGSIILCMRMRHGRIGLGARGRTWQRVGRGGKEASLP
ncbi:hypothetical protein B0I37DRAFT_46858 [Chaetomium sp. MPI-CAGE-AT-0009]|nr:hypothetical protein B0I37DRAFT_46858 [Chaetomium sp. MPI-CAGE-AT-0009]